QGVQLAGALPLAASGSRRSGFDVGSGVWTVLDLAVDDMNRAGAAGAAAAAGADNPNAVAARALEQGVAGLRGDDAIQVRKSNPVSRGDGGSARVLGHGARALPPSPR